MSKFEILIAHLNKSKDPVAEIYCGGACFALIEEKTGTPVIHFYPRPDKEEWEASCEEVLQTIKKAYFKIVSKQEKWKSYFPSAPNTAIEANQLGQKLLEEILNNLSKKAYQNRFGGLDIYEPSGRGARFNENKEFLGFLQARASDKSNGFMIVISSDVIYDQLCAEIYYEGEFIAIVTQEEGLDNAKIQIDPSKHAPKRLFNFSEFKKILETANIYLLAMERTQELRDC